MFQANVSKPVRMAGILTTQRDISPAQPAEPSKLCFPSSEHLATVSLRSPFLFTGKVSRLEPVRVPRRLRSVVVAGAHSSQEQSCWDRHCAVGGTAAASVMRRRLWFRPDQGRRCVRRRNRTPFASFAIRSSAARAVSSTILATPPSGPGSSGLCVVQRRWRMAGTEHHSPLPFVPVVRDCGLCVSP